jgi:hypothetical protein
MAETLDSVPGDCGLSKIGRAYSIDHQFLCSADGRFFVPAAYSEVPRTVAVRTDRRSPPTAARSGLGGHEHGATLDRVGLLHWGQSSTRGLY